MNSGPARINSCPDTNLLPEEFSGTSLCVRDKIAQLLVDSAQDATRLSHLRYSGGATSYLEVLTNDTNYFSAELGLVQAQLNELLALVQLYKGLGGGWQQ